MADANGTRATQNHKGLAYKEDYMLYYTNKARKSHVDEITRLINVLGNLKGEDLCYIDYRRLVEYLSDFKDLIKAEIDPHED